LKQQPVGRHVDPVRLIILNQTNQSLLFAASAVDHGFNTWLDQTKAYTIGMCCFSTKHLALRKKSKDWLV
jgi:hypothetical protein